MKKIMFMLAAVCAAVAVQAAYVDWQYEGNNAGGDTSWGGTKAGDASPYTAYLLTEAAYKGLGDTWDQSKLAAAAVDSSTLIYEKTGKGSKMYYTTHQDGGTTPSVRVVEAASGNYYVIIGNGTYFAVATGPASVTAYDDPTAAATGKTPSITLNGKDNTALSFNSYPSGDTPEPTSGLLLLVGGAMLALRRKQK